MSGNANCCIEYVKGGGIGVTRISLMPLREEDIVQFVAATLCINPSEIVPLAAVIQVGMICFAVPLVLKSQTTLLN